MLFIRIANEFCLKVLFINNCVYKHGFQTSTKVTYDRNLHRVLPEHVRLSHFVNNDWHQVTVFGNDATYILQGICHWLLLLLLLLLTLLLL